MTVLRGKGLGLEVSLGGRDFEQAVCELQGKLGEQPGFYSGSRAVIALGSTNCSEEQLARLRSLLSDHGVEIDALSGDPSLETLAADAGLRFLAAMDDGGEELARRRAMRPKREIQLSDAARSLVADFAGARSDIARRRQKGEPSVRRVAFAPEIEQPPAPDGPGTLFHVGTLRGGQALHNIGNIVVIGDVNPGAELVAGGDIAVFGSLRGVAHAGAQGDANARVYAIDLSATQLRIASVIAADAGDRDRTTVQPEAACVQNDRIVIVPLDRAQRFAREAP